MVLVSSKKDKPIIKNAFQVMGFFSGLVTVFVGAAGPLIAPLFLAEKISKETIIGTKAACQALGHFLKNSYLLLFFQCHLPFRLANIIAINFSCIHWNELWQIDVR